MIKKIVLFLFGIVLVVFGQKAAIAKITDKEEKSSEEPKLEEKKEEIPQPVIIEEVDTVTATTPEVDTNNIEKEKAITQKSNKKIDKKHSKVKTKTVVESDGTEKATATE